MVRRAMLAAGGFLLWGTLLFGQAPSGERFPITDPDRLESVGLPRDATNVYEWSKAATAVEAPETWGTAGGFTTVMGHELEPEHYSWLFRSPDETYCMSDEDNSLAQEAIAQFQFPEGAALLSLQFWAYDGHPVSGLTLHVYEHCNVVGYNPPTTTVIGSGDTLGASGHYYGSLPLNGHRVNNRDCGYSVRVIFIPGDLQCVGDQLALQKLQVSWVRQVSPSPAAATFGDVPTGHTLFQFVEALAKSGITGGCGNGNFCPDQPLTRGQMAVFLAKGLGLAWP